MMPKIFASGIYSQLSKSLQIAVHETHGFCQWQNAKQEPCELYEARHTNTGDYPLALPQNLFIFIAASKKQDKMLIN